MNLCFLGDIRSIHVIKFVRYFARNNTTHLISFSYPGDKRVEEGQKLLPGTTIYLFEKSLLAPFRIRDLVKTIKPDLVQAHFLTNYGFLGTFSGVHPLVVTAMGDDILIHPFNYCRPLVLSALHNADFITCDGMNSLENIRKFTKTEAVVIYPGIDMKMFHPSKKILLPYKTVCAPRGFDPIYDTPTLLGVIKRINREMPDVRFVLLGDGKDKEWFQFNTDLAELDEVVQFTGNVPYEDVPRYLASADVCITTSLSDGGIPVSTIEAVACGTPVVSTDAGDARLWLSDVVPIGDADAMARKVIRLLKNDEERKFIGRREREKVETTQDYEIEMKKIEDIYAGLIGHE